VCGKTQSFVVVPRIHGPARPSSFGTSRFVEREGGPGHEQRQPGGQGRPLERSHWKTAAFGWIAFAILAVVGGAVGAKEMKDWAIANGESRRAEQILDQGELQTPGARERARAVRDGDRRRAGVLVGGRGVVQTLSQQQDVDEHRLADRHPERRACLARRHSALVQFDVKGKADDAKDKIAPILARSTGARPATRA
jgi:hypothetical protein